MEKAKIQELKKIAQTFQESCDAEFNAYSNDPATISDVHNLATQVHCTLLEIINSLENS